MFYKFVILILPIVLSGCGLKSQNELRQWVVEQKKQPNRPVVKLEEHKIYSTVKYDQSNEMDPFNQHKILNIFKKELLQNTLSSNLIKFETNRTKELLEEYPLGKLSFMGNLIDSDKNVALISVDNIIYTVQLGEYIGQNFGKVINISKTQITVREVIQDPSGEWIERISNLNLQKKAN